MQSIRSRILYKLFFLLGSPFDASTPIAKQREYIERQGKLARLPSKVTVQPIAIEEMYAEWIRHDQARSGRAILYLHGGGYTMGSCNTHRALAARISIASRAPVFLIEYRLAPENPFPAALEDVNKAYHYLLEQKLEPGKTILAGDSAGGGLAAALTLRLRDEKKPLPAGIVCISPWADLTLSGETMTSCSKTDPLISRESSIQHAGYYVGGYDPGSPLISPIFGDLSQFPPMMLQVGEHETLRSDSERLAEKAREASVDVTLEIWEGMWHVWHAYAGLIPEAQRAIDRVGDFVSKRLD
jgi:monoterpene epsilon-lactone hydrolase